MVRIRLPAALVGTGIGAAAPTYQVVPGSWQPVTPLKMDGNGPLQGILMADPLWAQATVLVDVPDEDVTNGVLDAAKVKARYPNHPLVANGVIK